MSAHVQRQTRTNLYLTAAIAIVALLLAGANETPKKKNAVIFGPHPSAQGVDERIKRWLCAEYYDVKRYVWGRGEGAASLANLRKVATNGFAVLVIIAHGSSGSLTIEDYETEEAAKKAYSAAVADKANADIKDEIKWGPVNDIDRDGRPAQRYCVWLTPKALNKLFSGAAANRSIVCVLSCNSWGLQSSNDPKPFGGVDFVGYDGDLSNAARGKGARTFYYMGGPAGIPIRPVKPAAEKAGMKHMGPGNTTLAPACTDHKPPDDSELPLNVKTPGSTTYETIMSKAAAEIMTPEGCDAVISDQKWVDDLNHSFNVTPVKPGRLKLKVDPKKADSKNNNNWLIGNKYKMDEWEDRIEVPDCPYGQSGLDGEEDCPATENPFRWCVWCKTKPQDPGTPRQPSDPPQHSGDSSIPRNCETLERTAFVFYQDAPNDGNRIELFDLPPNMSWTPIEDWYGHVVFEPQDSQEGQTFDVPYRVTDDFGVRAEGVFHWQVDPRHAQMQLKGLGADVPYGELGEQVAIPGQSAQYLFRLTNTGNTVLTNIQLLPPQQLTGPDTIPSDAFELSATHVEVLAAGESAEFTLTVHTAENLLAGKYECMLEAHGLGLVEDVNASGLFLMQLDNPPDVEVPAEPLDVTVGVPVELTLTPFDSDGDAWEAYFDLGPAGGELSRQGDTLRLRWTPSYMDRGSRAFSLIVSDGVLGTARELQFTVATDDCNPDRPSVVYVDASALGTEDGRSWENAITDLSRALDIAACVSTLSEIWIADGVYYPAPAGGDRNRTFALRSNLAIYGGFRGDETSRGERNPINNVTTLSGDLNGDDDGDPALYADNSYHVVVAGSGVDSTAVLDGFVITSGNADGVGDPDFTDAGGGMRIAFGGPTISNCIVTHNRAKFGGGVEVFFGTPALTDCAISANHSDSEGGGLHNNRGRVTLTRCTFEANEAGGFGGGLRLVRAVTTATDCEFLDNTAASGGAMLIDNSSTPSFDRTLIRGNSGTSNAGAIHVDRGSVATFINALIEGNDAGVSGGAAYVTGAASKLQLYDSTISQNRATTGGGMYSAAGATTIANAILYYNEDDGGSDESAQIHVAGGTVVINYACVQGWTGSLGGSGNFDLLPKFVALGSWSGSTFTPGDAHLASDSPCIDVGDNASVPGGVTLDLDGLARVTDGDGDSTAMVDLGAHEAAASSPVLLADMNCDGAVDFDDIDPFVIALISRDDYESQYPDCNYLNADINQDGSVNFDDIDGFVECLINGECP